MPSKIFSAACADRHDSSIELDVFAPPREQIRQVVPVGLVVDMLLDRVRTGDDKQVGANCTDALQSADTPRRSAPRRRSPRARHDMV